MKIKLLFLIQILYITQLFAVTSQDIENIQLQKAKDLQNATLSSQPKAPDVFLSQPKEDNVTASSLPEGEKPCFFIKPENISLQGEEASRFEYALKGALKELHYKQEGECVGLKGINTIYTSMQNILIKDGYVTTRVLIGSQDLSSGKLTLTLIPGRVDKVVFAEGKNITSLSNAMPLKHGSILNLRDIEQGLENLKRVPTADASMQIEPSKLLGYSNVVITYTKKNPLRFNFSLDDAGSSSTGKIQGSATLSLDNPTGLNDLLYYSFTKGIADIDTASLNSQSMSGLSNNHMFGYSIPFGYYLLSFLQSKYHYEQAVVGASQIYNYSGNSLSRELGFSRVFYRDNSLKLTGTVKGWQRTSDNFIDDAEVTVQRRRTAGYEIEVGARDYIQNVIFDITLGYKRGTGAFNSLRAPEEAWGEGTSKMQIYTLDASLSAPFMLLDNSFVYNGSLQAQYNSTPLTAQDSLSIGGRYTVRGFGGEYTLMGDRGVVSRNELDWNYLQNHMLYLAFDLGHIDGQRAKTQIGNTLVGSAFGCRGNFSASGNLAYDLFLGVPLRYPDGFPKDDITGGFSINYSF